MRSYKSWDTLVEAIESARAQTAFKLPGEKFNILGVVPIDDTRTVKIFEKHGIEVIKTAKPDITEQSNIGFAAADSDFVLVFDSDDYMYPNMLLSLYMSACRFGAHVAYCDYEMWGPDGFDGVVPCHDGQYSLEEGCFITELCMFSRRGWERLGGFDESLWRYAQWDYFLRPKKAGMKILHVPFQGFRYRVGPGQLSSRLHRGEMKDKDDPLWEVFKKRHGLTNAQTIGHGGHWTDWEASCPA
jgi:glycosyltransferase involved in cell wall biosynthesis